MSLNAHARPPDSMKVLFKKWQKTSISEIATSPEIIDLTRLNHSDLEQLRGPIGASNEMDAGAFTKPWSQAGLSPCEIEEGNHEHLVYELKALPGLFLYPSLLSLNVQVTLLNKILHRDLSNKAHNTNLHLHYDIAYPQDLDGTDSQTPSTSFFEVDKCTLLAPKDPLIHKPITMKQVLERKLRWVTLGGQYDWTAKVYPVDDTPQFPEDIALLLKAMFPDIDAQAAIVNFYTPGDTLSVHRDVSEECDRGLVSISLGCDGLFIVGNDDGSIRATIRLGSGDVVLMSGGARFAWHAVPKIISGTCPTWLEAWPAITDDVRFKDWRGWIANKRININVRQMRD